MKYGMCIVSTVFLVIILGTGCDPSSKSKENTMSYVKSANELTTTAGEGVDFVNLFDTKGKASGWRPNALAALRNKGVIGLYPLMKISGNIVQKGELSGNFSVFSGIGQGHISGQSYPEMMVMYACSFGGNSVNIGILPVSKVDFLIHGGDKVNAIRLQYDIEEVICDAVYNTSCRTSNMLERWVEKMPKGELLQSKYINKATVYITQSGLESQLYVKLFSR